MDRAGGRLRAVCARLARGGGALALVVGQLLAAPLAPALAAPRAAPADAGDRSAGVEEAPCAALARAAVDGAPVEGLVITAARAVPAGSSIDMRDGAVTLPAHCLVEGHYGEYAGAIGGPYRTGFQMRLPRDWNGRFLFEGGGGSNGIIRAAIGLNGPGNVPALLRGYAVITQDSGHDNSRNAVPDHGGDLVFGFDPAARRNYGHASLKASYDLGRHLIRSYYGRDSDVNFFWGCSKGGQEGMAFAQRYPDAFDGIVAMAPGFSLPRAAVAQAWDTQHMASVLRQRGITPSMATLSQAASPAQLAIVAQTITATCDADDGAADGIIGAIGLCTSARVVPALRERQCDGDGQGDCLDGALIDALAAIMDGVRDSGGRPLYAPFPWDTGIAGPGWAAWKVGIEGRSPALNVVLGAGSLAAVFTSPPTALTADATQLLQWQLAFDFDRGAPKIYAAAAPYATSAWDDVGMRSPDLAAFRARGGKLIVPHGMSDPVFSAYDTIAWWEEVDRLNAGRAADFVRMFPVPGMNHCGGGPATDRFDSLGALEAWVLRQQAPDMIAARAGDDTPWPGRERPLCPYPQVALASNGTFACKPAPAGARTGHQPR